MDESLALFSGIYLLVVLCGWIAFGVAGFVILDRVDKAGIGLLLGLTLGPIGLVLAWLMRDSGIREEAEAQAHRHRDLERDVERISRRPVGAPPAPAASDFGADVVALERLAKLRDSGHVTVEEFEAKKRQVLGIAVPPGGGIAAPVASRVRRFR